MGNTFSARTILLGLGILALFALALLYVGFQARFLISGPTLSLTHTYPILTTENAISIEGLARNTSVLVLNGKAIFTDEHGHFEELLVLEDGYTIMTLKGEDRFGRQVTLEKTFVRQPNL